MMSDDSEQEHFNKYYASDIIKNILNDGYCNIPPYLLRLVESSDLFRSVIVTNEFELFVDKGTSYFSYTIEAELTVKAYVKIL